MELITRWWKTPSQMDTYFRLLEDNFQELYSSTPVDQLQAIAKKKMPELPEEVFGWPEETLHAILGELAFFSKPEIIHREQIIESNLICSNKAQVVTQRILFERGYIGAQPPEVVEHVPDHILRVIDPTINKRHRFCPDHPVSDINTIWQAPTKRRK